MKVLEHGGRIGRTLLFFPCTAEPVWVFEQYHCAACSEVARVSGGL